ncbi:hypothetical protein [uncultured Porticoccus sp.]|uniref:hypothetical protein n=1 Tax=uncultured Porticoccus sp. TaxID=1256050 RepID=UPI002619B3DF|nr:hypothetical protein [uncultured Porticoccus sp.]
MLKSPIMGLIRGIRVPRTAFADTHRNQALLDANESDRNQKKDLGLMGRQAIGQLEIGKVVQDEITRRDTIDLAEKAIEQELFFREES